MRQPAGAAPAESPRGCLTHQTGTARPARRTVSPRDGTSPHASCCRATPAHGVHHRSSSSSTWSSSSRITQVTAFMADDLGWRGALRGLVLLALLWWAWCSYAWLGNQAHADEGVVRAPWSIAMAAMFLVALAIPEAWGDEGGGISAPVVLAVAFARGPAGPPGRVRRRGGRRLGAASAAAAHGAARSCAAAGSAGGRRGRSAGSRRRSLWALALRDRLHRRLRRGHRLAAAVAAALRRAPRADPDHRAGGVDHRRRRGGGRPADHAARRSWPRCWAWRSAWRCGGCTSTWSRRWRSGCSTQPGRAPSGSGWRGTRYTYLHFPMIAGIIYLALGLKKVAEYVADTEHHSLGDPLHQRTGLWALYGGVARLPARRTWASGCATSARSTAPRAVVAVVLLVGTAPGRGSLPALAALGVLAVHPGRADRLRGGALRRGARRHPRGGRAPLSGGSAEAEFAAQLGDVAGRLDVVGGAARSGPRRRR